MNKILVTYATMSGSTAEVAQVIGEEMAGEDIEIDVLPLEQVASLAGYRAVVLGAPMIMGWHRSAIAFLKKHHKELEHTPLALFALAMSLTSTGEMTVKDVPVCADPILAKPPKDSKRRTFRENYTSISHYAAPMIKAAGENRPVTIAFFGGKLEIFRLPLWAKLFVMLIVQAAPGDRRNWKAIRSWAGSLPELIENNHTPSTAPDGIGETAAPYRIFLPG